MLYRQPLVMMFTCLYFDAFKTFTTYFESYEYITVHCIIVLHYTFLIKMIMKLLIHDTENPENNQRSEW